MATNKPSISKPMGKIVRLTWGPGEDLPTLYANHMIVTHGGESEFHIVFGHLTPPLIVPESPDDIPDTLTIKPVAKIVVTPDNMKKFIKAMISNLENFEKRELEAGNDN